MADHKPFGIEGEVKNDVETASAELSIDPVAEKRLVRKLDMWLDRSNIGNAAIAGMNEDLNLDGNKLNVAVTVFYGILARPWERHITHRLCSDLHRLRDSRVVGPKEIGTKPPNPILYHRLECGHHRRCLRPELRRASGHKTPPWCIRVRPVPLLFVAAALSGSFGGLLAYGLTSLHGAKGLAGWRWLFLVEGLISIVVGIMAVFILPDSFETAWWLRDDEKALMRIRHERAKVYHGSEVFDKSEIKLAFKDPKVWLSAFCQFCANICSFGFSTFLPKIINGFGYSSVRTQLLTVPVYAWAAVIYVAVSFLSDHINKRAVFMVPMAMVTMTGYSLLIGVSMSSTAVLYFATFVTATGIYCVVGLNVTWISNSNAGYFKRATAIGLQQTIGNSAGIVAGQIYRLTNSDGRYVIGHAVSLAAIICAGIGYSVMWLTLWGLNRKRENMSVEEKAKAIDGGKRGDAHPEFRYNL